LGTSFFLLCAFPTIGLPGSTTDVQPWAFAAALLVLAASFAVNGDLRIPRWYVWFAVVTAGFLLLYSLDVLVLPRARELNLDSGARLMFGVLSLPLIALTVYRLGHSLSARLFLAVYSIWLFVALVQLVVPDFGAFLLPRVSTGAGRGVTSLAPEPYHYGRVVIAFTVLAFFMHVRGLLSRRALLWVLALSLFQVFFLSRSLSSVLIGVIVVLTIVWRLFTRPFARTLAVVCFAGAVGATVWAGIRYLADFRAFYLLGMLLEQPEYWATQGGFLLRVLNPFLSFQVGLFETGARGAGLAATPVAGLYTELWPLGVEWPLSERAHGGLVGLVYSAGAVGLLFVVVFYRELVRALRSIEGAVRQRVLGAGLILMTFVYFFDLSVADPLHAYIFGYLLLWGHAVGHQVADAPPSAGI
jgi:hypothetical protein